MRLVRGARLGPYEILAPLGAGGMGEVYRARDRTLEREVAIKILPDALAQNPERLARFAREAKVLASLNHPNIAQIYGVEDGALVMELAPGQTLLERIAAGPVPLEEALRIGAQIAEALAAAHERGVIHRDLKPANVTVTPDGRVKVLDFGLAKPFAEEIAGGDSGVETLSATMTQAGTIVGTPGYMSPEQARGRAVDKRTDIWALGCLLYELLTQRRVFGGETSSDAIAAVLEREPAWDALPPATPQRVRDLLQRCLRKDMRRRARDAGDIAIELEEALTAPASVEPSGLAPRPRSRWMRAVPFLLAATAIAAALAGGYLQRALGPSAPASMTRLTALLPPNDRFATGLCPDIAVSPDGKLVAYIGVHAGRSQIFLRAMDSSEATAVPGTERASDTLFFSPDGQWLGFLQSNPNVLRKVPVSGGSPVTLANTPGCGADWGPEDQIFLSRTDGIFQIPAGGGPLKPLITADLSKGEQGLGFPQLLPGGKAMLFTVQTDQGFQIVAQRLASGERHILVKGDDPPPTGASGRYAPPGFLVYSQADGLMAAQFSVERLELTGPPVTIARGGGQIGSQFSLSRSAEALAYVQSEPRPPSTLVWVNRKGAEEAMGAVPGQYSVPRLSPDDHKVVLAADSNIWLYDIARRTLTRITSGGDNRSPVWTPDGSRITYTKNGAICSILADGNSHEDALWKGTFGLPSSWSPNGERLLFTEMKGDNQIDISVLSVQGERTATPVVQSRFVQAEAIFSPDGRRFAYSSNESGQPEIYLREFPGPGGKAQISSEGGSNPVWSRKGRELFYRNGDKMMVVDITAAPVFQAATPRALFERRYNHSLLRNFDVTADGQRFVMVKSGGAAPPVTQLNVVLNWLGDVRRRAAAK